MNLIIDCQDTNWPSTKAPSLSREIAIVYPRIISLIQGFMKLGYEVETLRIITLLLLFVYKFYTYYWENVILALISVHQII